MEASLGLGMPPTSRGGNAYGRIVIATNQNLSVEENETFIGMLTSYVPSTVLRDVGGEIVTEDGIPVHLLPPNLTWEIVGGADAEFFEIDPHDDTAACDLLFLDAPNYEDPQDADANNIYEVQVRVSGGGTSTTLAIHVTVTDESEIDADAAAFLTAAGISDGTITNAIHNLVVAIKSASLWTAAKAIYPFVGGTAGTHKWNLKDPRDLDAAFRLTFTGTWTHSSNGADPGGSDSHADTKIAGNSLTSTGAAMGTYLRDNNNGAFCDMGCNTAGGIELTIYARYSGSSFMNFGTNSYALNAANSDSRGMWTCGRVNGSTSRSYHNGAQVGTTDHAVTLPAETIFLGARNAAGSAAQRSPNQIALAFVMNEAWNTTKDAALYAAVQAFQTALGRQV